MGLNGASLDFIYITSIDYKRRGKVNGARFIDTKKDRLGNWRLPLNGDGILRD